jgi:3',5'-nucleoside bisphosphate phosphatase
MPTPRTGLTDLHLHTTASDGRSSPDLLVREVIAAGIGRFAVADHDTVAAVPIASRLAQDARLEFVPGVEITAVHNGRDVHMLGYFFDPDSPALLQFLEDSRADRLRRARQMCEKLAECNVPVSFDDLLQQAGPTSGKSIARPLVAKALLRAGHVASVQEAFDRFLAEDRPAYVARTGASPAEVVRLIADAGGITSLAHPGPLGRDELIPTLAAQGLTALECFHSEHDEATTTRYLGLAQTHGLLVTGGSDFHGADDRRAAALGRVGLPRVWFDRLAERARLARQRT